MGEKRRKKRRVNPLKVGIAIGIFAIIVVLVVLLLGKGKDIISKEAMYLASSDKVVKLYILDDDGNLKEDKNLVRGTKVSSYKNTVTKDNKSYTKIDYDKSIYYVDSGSLVKDAKSAVLEKVKYVRTSVTVYQNSEDSKIESFIKKGNKIDVTDLINFLKMAPLICIRLRMIILKAGCMVSIWLMMKRPLMRCIMRTLFMIHIRP